MDTISGAGLARELGTSVPRVTRAVERLGIDAKQANGRLALTRPQADRVRRELGVTPRAGGLTRSETLVLAALRSAPFGLVSTRAVARRSGLSPTTAGRALRSLQATGLAMRASETIAAGKARRMEVWHANIRHRRWSELDPILHRVAPARQPQRRERQVPRRLRHLFWNTARSQLDVDRAGAYIARRLLRTMDMDALAWGARVLEPSDWEEGARARGLDAGTRQLARNLAEASR